MLRWEQFRRIVDNIIIENVSCSLHPLIKWLLRENGWSGFFRFHVAALNQKFLEFEQVILNVLILLQERVLISGLAHLEVLLSQIIDGRLVFLLKFLHLNWGIYDVCHGSLDFCGFIVKSLTGQLGLRSFSIFLPIHQDLKVLIEFLWVLEAFEDIMSVNEALRTSIHSILEVELVLFILDSKLTLIQHYIDLFEDYGDEFCIFVADIT